MHCAGLGWLDRWEMWDGWLDGREVWDGGGGVIVSMIFVILQERKKVFIWVPGAWLPCREECRKVRNVREYVCGSGSYFFRPQV